MSMTTRFILCMFLFDTTLLLTLTLNLDCYFISNCSWIEDISSVKFYVSTSRGPSYHFSQRPSNQAPSPHICRLTFSISHSLSAGSIPNGPRQRGSVSTSASARHRMHLWWRPPGWKWSPPSQASRPRTHLSRLCFNSKRWRPLSSVSPRPRRVWAGSSAWRKVGNSKNKSVRDNGNPIWMLYRQPSIWVRLPLL